MSEQTLLLIIGAFIVGLICGVVGMLLLNKVRSGSVSAGKVKKEKDDYQQQVEAHFEQTSKKFESLSSQYQDLYQHLSVGATTLCRPENIGIGLSDQRDPLATKEIIADKDPVKGSAKPEAKSADKKPGSKPANKKPEKVVESEKKVEKQKPKQPS